MIVFKICWQNSEYLVPFYMSVQYHQSTNIYGLHVGITQTTMRGDDGL